MGKFKKIFFAILLGVVLSVSVRLTINSILAQKVSEYNKEATDNSATVLSGDTNSVSSDYISNNQLGGCGNNCAGCANKCF